MNIHVSVLFWTAAGIALVVLPALTWVFCRRDRIAQRPIYQAMLAPVIAATAFLLILCVWMVFALFPQAFGWLPSEGFFAGSLILVFGLPMLMFRMTLGAEGMRSVRWIALSTLATTAVLAEIAFCWLAVVKGLRLLS